jgi:hypothetical protein
VRHRDAHVLVRHDHDFRQAPAELLALGERLDHGAKSVPPFAKR